MGGHEGATMLASSLSPEERRRRDAEVIRMSEEGVPRLEIAKKFGLTGPRVSQITNGGGQSSSVREHLLLVLQEFADERGRVDAPFHEIMAKLKESGSRTDGRIIVQLLRNGLRKAGYVHTVWSNGHTHETASFTEIRLTEKGLKWRPERVRTLIPSQPRFSGQQAPEIAETVEAEPPKQSEEPPEPETAETGSEAATGGPDPDATTVIFAETRQEAERMGFGLMYPLLARLRARKVDLENAAKILDSHGLAEAALAAIEASEPKDPLEIEILRYMASHGD
jgi:hypothetical protein